MNFTLSEILSKIELHPVLITIVFFVLGIIGFFLRRWFFSKPIQNVPIIQSGGSISAGGNIVAGSKVTINNSTSTPAPKAVIQPPVSYQIRALSQIIDHLKRQEIDNLTIKQFAQVIGTDGLRDDVDPMFEPVTIDSLSDAINQFVASGTITIINDRVQITDK